MRLNSRCLFAAAFGLTMIVLPVRPVAAALSVPFLYCLFRTDQFADHTYAHSTGTTVLHLSKEAVPSYQFVLPPEELCEKFAHASLLIFERIDAGERESRTLAALRDTLLPKLLSGEIRVGDADSRGAMTALLQIF